MARRWIPDALVTNTGDFTGTYEATLKIDDVAVATKSVTLAGGASEKVTFAISKVVGGTYSVDLNGLLGTFVVKAGLNWWLIGGIIAAIVIATGLLLYVAKAWCIETDLSESRRCTLEVTNTCLVTSKSQILSKKLPKELCITT